ncbi:hypothetical protein ABIE44_002868 [Marmoricola sp. OAE513]|uniref:hypothetical protein n=1 Tax=Marmoricola sp. OAE513 TaxID=2817894 RepID=UPI001AE7A674
MAARIRTGSGEQRYGPTAGTVTGWLGLVVCVALAAVFAVVDVGAARPPWICGFVGGAVVIWATMLRPVIVVRAPDQVELRNPLSSWLIPLASVEVVQVRAVTRVVASGTPYDAVAVGRRIRKMVRNGPERVKLGDFGPNTGVAVPVDPPTARFDVSTPEALADLMTEQILAAAEDARRTGKPAGPAVRSWAVLEIALLGVAAVAFVVSLFVT